MTNTDIKKTLKGKKREYYDRAERLYIEDHRSIAEVRAALDNDVSEPTLREWREWGDWDRKRAERVKNEKSLDDTLLEIAASRVDFLKDKAVNHSAQWSPADTDELAKMNRISLRKQDTKATMQNIIKTVTELATHIVKRNPEDAARFSEHFDSYLNQKQEELSNV